MYTFILMTVHKGTNSFLMSNDLPHILNTKLDEHKGEKKHTSDPRATWGEYCELPSISVNCDLLWERTPVQANTHTHTQARTAPLHTFSVYRVKHLTEKRQDSSTFSRPPKNKFLFQITGSCWIVQMPTGNIFPMSDLHKHTCCSVC